MTSVVCDSGPLTHLWQVGQWRSFCTFDVIYVPAQVAVEVERHVPLAQMATFADRAVGVEAVSEQEIVTVRQFVPAGLTLHDRSGNTGSSATASA